MKLIAIVLSLQLIISPVAYSQDTQKAQTDAQIKNANTVEIGSNAGYEKSSQSENGFALYGKQGLSIANAIVGSSIITQCAGGLKLTSIQLFWAGTAAYLISEMTTGGKDQNQGQNRSMGEVDKIATDMQMFKGGGAGDVQREIIEKRLEDEKRTEKFIKERKTWLTAVMAIYTAAAAMAIAEEMMGIATGTGLGTSVCSSLAANYAAPCGKKYPACYAKHFAACTASMPTGWASALPNFANPALPATTMANCGTTGIYFNACASYLTGYLGQAYAACIPNPGPTIAFGITASKAIAAAYSIGITSASGNGAASNVALLYNLISYFVSALAIKVMAAYNLPIPRAVTFGALAALVGGIMSGLDDRLKNNIQPNIKKLTALRDSFNRDTSSIDSGLAHGTLPNQNTKPEVSKLDITTPNASGNSAVKPLAGGSVMKLCQIENQLEYSEKCVTPLELGRPIVPANIGLNNVDQFRKTSELSVDMANKLARGEFEKARAMAGEIGASLNVVKQTHSDMQGLYNKNAIQNETEQIDWAAKSREEMGRMENTFQAATQNNQFAALKGNDLGMRSGLNTTGMGDAGNSANSSSAEVKTNASLSDDQRVTGININGDASTDAASGPNTNSNILNNLNSEEYMSDEERKKLQEELWASNRNGFDELDRMLKRSKDQEDISKFSNLSLFKQISYRYYKSLDKVLIRKKRPEVMSK